MRALICLCLLLSACSRPFIGADRWLDAVVVLRNQGTLMESRPSGFFISPTEILTAGHALGVGRPVKAGATDVLTTHGLGYAHIKNSLGGPHAPSSSDDVLRDIGLLQLVEGGPKTRYSVDRAPGVLSLAREDAAVGEIVLAVGSPHGTIGDMVACVVGRAARGMICGAMLEPGWSGGPLLNTRGEVAGLITSGWGSTTLAIPASAIKQALVELRK
jgi:S1-C subfamily serine protease